MSAKTKENLFLDSGIILNSKEYYNFSLKRYGNENKDLVDAYEM